MTNPRKWLKSALCLLVVLAMVCGVMPGICLVPQAAALTPESDWTTVTGTITDNGDGSYTTDGSWQDVMQYEKKGGYNCFEMDFNASAIHEDGANLSVGLVATENSITVRYWPALGVVTILYGGAELTGGSELVYTGAGKLPYTLQDTVRLKFVFTDYKIALFADGQLVAEANGSFETDFDNASLMISNFRYVAKLSNFATSTVAPGWTTVVGTITDNGDGSYTTDGAWQDVMQYEKKGGFNCFEMDFNASAIHEDGANLSVGLVAAENSITVRYWPNLGTVSILYGGAEITAGTELVNTGAGKLPYTLNDTVRLKFVFTESKIALYADDVLVAEANGSFATDFANAALVISNFRYVAKLSNFATSTVAPGWTTVVGTITDNGDGSYTTDGSWQDVMQYEKKGGFNCFEMDFNASAIYEDGANLSVGLVASENSITVRYWPNLGTVSILYGGAEITAGAELVNTGAGKLPYTLNDTVRLKFVFTESKIALYADDVLVAEANGSFATDFANAALVISNFRYVAKLSNMKTSIANLTPADTWTAGQYWTKGQTDGAYSFDAHGSELTYTKTLEANSVEFEVKFNAAGEPTSNIGVYLRGDGSATMRYYPVQGNIAFQYGSSWNTLAVVGGTENGTSPASDWMKLKFAFTGTCMAVYINDQLAAWTEGVYALSLDALQASVWTWGVTGEIRNLTLCNTAIQLPTVPAEPWTTGSTWTKGDADGAYSFAGHGSELTYTREVEMNSVEFEALFNAGGEPTTNITLFLRGDIGVKMGYYPVSGDFNITCGNADFTNMRNIASAGSTAVQEGQWIKLKFVYTNACLAIFADDQLMAYKFGAFDVDLEDLQASVWTWGVSGQIRNLTFTSTDLSTLDLKELDLTFTSVGGVNYLEKDNMDLAWDDGKLLGTFTGQNPTITVPEINVAKGHIYSMRLGVSNTFVVRLFNDSDADSITLFYVTAEEGEYSAARTKTFPIEPNSGWKTYYFNISDTVSCTHWLKTETMKNCNCYLRGFKLQFNGATEGQVQINEIFFSREDKIYDYAAENVTIVADKAAGTVTVSGTLKSEFANSLVTVVETDIRNYNELLDWSSNKAVAMGTANGTQFSITFPLANGNMTHLSTPFLVAVGDDYRQGTKLADILRIENWEDFAENPYEFTLNALTVDVTDAQFGAKGDGFTNDTAAIQAAIDYVNAQGGGKVVIPGEPDNDYGRRYVITGVDIKSNVELYISEGAILWQSHDYDNYPYELYFGHENQGTDVAWALSSLQHLPFLYIHDAENVKISGGGSIRLDDQGTQWLDGNGYSWDSDIRTCDSSNIHLEPVGVVNSTNISITDLTVTRGACWHVVFSNASNVFLGNVHLKEVDCINADGFSFQNGTNHVMLERCSLYSNDDAIVLFTNHNDPRHEVSPWLGALNGKSLHDIKVRHCNVFGGHGLTIIPWATGMEDEDQVEINNIDVQDSVLGGTSTAIGAWADNPFYGTSSMWLNTYSSNDSMVEAGDYSPFRDLILLNNRYVAPTSFYGVPVTNVISDVKIIGATGFVNGNFDKDAQYGTGIYGTGYADEATWRTGLAWWSRFGSVGVEKIGTQEVSYVNVDKTFIQDNYAGYIQGEGELFQGIYNTFGAYIATVDVKLVSGTAKLFVRDSLTGEILAEKVITAADSFETVSIGYTLSKGAYVQIGISHQGADDTIVYLDNASVVRDPSVNVYEIEGETLIRDFNAGESDFVNQSNGTNVSVKDQMLTAGNDGEYKLMFNNLGKLNHFELTVDIYIGGSDAVNAGVYLFAGNVHTGADAIDAYNVQLESKAGAGSFTVTMFRFDNQFTGTSASGGSFGRDGDWVTLRIVVKNDTVFVFVGDAEAPCITFEVAEGLSGNVGLRSQYTVSRFDNFSIKTSQYAQPGDRSQLDGLVEKAEAIVKTEYTAESYKALADALRAAYALDMIAAQDHIDACCSMLTEAIHGLVPVDAPVETKKDTYTFGDASDLEYFDMFGSDGAQWKVEDGKLVPGSAAGEYKLILKDSDKNIHKISVDIFPGSNLNIALYINASGAGNAQDQINALAVILESNFAGWEDAANRVDIIMGSFPQWQELSRFISETGNNNALYQNGNKEPLHLEVEINGNILTVTVSLVSDPGTFVQTQYRYTGEGDLSGGQVGIRCQVSDCTFDNFEVEYIVDAESEPDVNPDTGDSAAVVFALAILSLVAMGTLWFVSQKKKILVK